MRAASTPQRTSSKKASAPQGIEAKRHSSHIAPTTHSTAQDGGIAGGYTFVGTRELCLAWTCLQEGRIRPLEVRLWLAAHEVRHRRKWLRGGRAARFRADELLALVGGGGEAAIRQSLRKLARLGLVAWSEAGPSFADSPSKLNIADPTELLELENRFHEMLGCMPRRRARIPLPRRMLRMLAGGVKKSVLATVLGHLVRCLYFDRKAGSWSGTGACKASWVAETFGVGTSSVHRARAHLRDELEWLADVSAPQWFQNRYGGRFEVSLQWSAAPAPAATPASAEQAGVKREEEPERPPEAPTSTACQPERAVDNLPGESSPVEVRLRGPQPGFGAELRGPVKNRPPSRRGIQPSDPAPGGARPPADACIKQVGEGTTCPGADRAPGRQQFSRRSSGKPCLQDVKPQDLKLVSSVMELFDQALVNRLWQQRGWSPPQDSYMERLNWAAAAHRARVRGGANPAGLFVHLVSRRLWEHISQDDEEEVRLKLAAWRDGVDEEQYTKPERTYGEYDLDEDEILSDAEFARVLERSQAVYS